jgi:hypothetical protein
MLARRTLGDSGLLFIAVRNERSRGFELSETRMRAIPSITVRTSRVPAPEALFEIQILQSRLGWRSQVSDT